MRQIVRFIALLLIAQLFAVHQNVWAASSSKQPLKKQYIAGMSGKYSSSLSMRRTYKAAKRKKAARKAAAKRITVGSAKIYPYRPEKLVRVDFSKVDFQFTGATNADFTGPMPASETVCVKQPCGFDAMRFFLHAEIKAEKEISDALVHFYSQNPAFIWSDNGMINKQAEAVLAYFARAGEDGLNPVEYIPELPDMTLEGEAQTQALAAFDIMLSARVLRYISDARGGRMIANRLSAYHDLPRKPIAFDEALTEIRNSNNPAQMLGSYQPQSKWYVALKSELAALGKANTASSRIEPDVLIRPGEVHPELPKIMALLKTQTSQAFMEKFHDVLEAYADSTTYNIKLKPAVKAYQTEAGKVADGIIGPITVAALQGETLPIRQQRIIYAMERLRWLPHAFSDRYVFVNQPAFEAQYFENGMEKLAMKAVIGSQRYPTNFFYDTIRLVVFNPYWGVPRSIVMGEMMPRILADPSYLTRNGYEVYNRNGKKVSPHNVNWRSVIRGNYNVSIRQKPGPHNALGELKILFPNKHDIYLHDTPAKSSFTQDMRAISHGCVRLSRPREMAAAVMGVQKDDLQSYFGKRERAVTLRETVPVYLTYFTAWPDAATHEIRYYDDVYGLDRAMQQADEVIHQDRRGTLIHHNG